MGVNTGAGCWIDVCDEEVPSASRFTPLQVNNRVSITKLKKESKQSELRHTPLNSCQLWSNPNSFFLSSTLRWQEYSTEKQYRHFCVAELNWTYSFQISIVSETIVLLGEGNQNLQFRNNARIPSWSANHKLVRWRLAIYVEVVELRSESSSLKCVLLPSSIRMSDLIVISIVTSPSAPGRSMHVSQVQ